MRFKSKKRLIGAFCMMSTLFLAFSGTFPTMRTGAPGDNGTCANCHSNNGSFSGQINMTGISGTANGGDVLSITTEVEVLSGSPVRAGFSVVALDDTNNAQAGDWLSGDGSFQMSGGREYWGHQPSLNFGGGSTVSWDADWEAPNITDDVTFYICAVLGNGSGTGGDKVECITETLSVSGATPLSVVIGMEGDATCEDSDNGTAEAVASGGTPPYNYEWDNGETTAVAMELTAGTHSVTVTDDDGNTATASTSIDVESVLVLDAEITNIICHGLPQGSIDVITTGGFPPYSCDWDNLPSGCFHNNLAPGDYAVTVTDFNGCTAEEIFEVEDVDPLNLDLIPANESVAGAMDGSIITSVDGGVTPYSYNWSSGATTTNLMGISAGVYSVTVTDDNNCTTSATITISTDSTPCALSAQPNVMDANCFGGTGGIGLFVMGANGTVTYNWSDNSTGSSLVNAPAGTYSVTITDAANCQTELLGIQIMQPDSLALNLVDLEDVLCPGSTDGELIVAAAGGVGDYVLTWGFGLTNDTVIAGIDTLVNIPDTLTGLTPQLYPYSLVDGNNCVTNGFYGINSNDSLAPTLVLQQGMVELDINGNAPPADFTLVDGGSFDDCGITNVSFTTPAFSCADIGINNYTVFVSDASGNTSSAVASVQVFETVPPVINCANSNATVNSCGPVNYLIPTATDNCDIPTLTIVSGLQSGSVFPAGQSTVVYRATDACGNSSTCDFTISVTNTLMTSVNTTPASCMNATGSITVTASGGTPPYSFAPFGTQSGLAAGLYSITVTDNTGCEVVEQAIISQADGPNLEFTNILEDPCGDAPGGAVTITVNGGVAPFELSVNNGFPNTLTSNTITLDSLSGGDYTVFVRDASNCTVQSIITIPSPSLPMATLPDFALACFGDSIFVDFSDINPNYTFGGYPGFAGPGGYEVVVTDNSTGCTSLAQFNVTSPPSLAIESATLDPVLECDLDLNAIDVTVTGGIAPYMVATTFVGDSIQGPYNIVVSDANGCTVERSYVFDNISAAPALAVDIDITYGCDGSFVFSSTESGGCPPITREFIPMFDVLAPVAGDYLLQLSSASGDTLTTPFTVIDYMQVVDVNVDIQNITSEPGSVTVDIEGGIEPYAFVWTSEAGDTLSTEQNLPAIINSPQTVTLEVTDSQGCITLFTYPIEMEVGTVDFEQENNLVTLYPNPVDEIVFIDFKESLPLNAGIYSTRGDLITRLDLGQKQMTIRTEQLVPGLYFIKFDFGETILVKQFMKI